MDDDSLMWVVFFVQLIFHCIEGGLLFDMFYTHYVDSYFVMIFLYCIFEYITFEDIMYRRICRSLSKENFVSVLSSYIKSNPKLEFTYQAFSTVSDETGRYSNVTYEGKETFLNHSVMDISGKIVLDFDSEKEFDFYKIEVSSQFCFDCGESAFDQNAQFDNFCNICLKEHKDSYNAKDVSVVYENIKQNIYYVSTGSKCKCWYVFLYTICNFLTVTFCFKAYIKKKIKPKTVNIKKVFSSRNDLTEDRINVVFEDNHPYIHYGEGKVMFFEKEEICHKNNIALRSEIITEQGYQEKYSNLVYKNEEKNSITESNSDMVLIPKNN